MALFLSNAHIWYDSFKNKTFVYLHTVHITVNPSFGVYFQSNSYAKVALDQGDVEYKQVSAMSNTIKE